GIAMSTDCLGNFTSGTQNCSISWSYIRPGQGMSIIPCLLVAVLLVIHVPVAIVRIVRWESVQVWSLALAALAIAMTSLAYKSTSYDPQQIYVWTSLPLILDVGAMIQLFALLFQDAHRV